jgi:amino acid adenylation domain-containing protein
MDCIEAVMPCTPLQTAMMAQFIKSEGRDYFNFIDFELADGVSPATLAASWRGVSLAHPLLRTGIVPVEHPDCAVAMVQYHRDGFAPAVAAIPAGQAETFDLQSWRLAAAQAAKGSPHSQLWSVAIVETERSMAMHLAIHHVLYDAYSLQVILDDLSRAIVGGVLLPRPHTQEAITDILGQVSSAAESSARFWKSQVDKVVINGFPVMTPLRQEGRSILTESTLSTAALATLEEAASRSGHTLQVILQAAWARILSAYVGERSVVFGVVLSGRNTEATRNAVFPCISTLPVIATNTESNLSLLHQMLQYNAALYKQQHQPLTLIQQWLGWPDARLFDTLLVYQKLDRKAPEERPWRIVNESASVDYPVSIEVEPNAGDRLGYRITFFSDFLSKEQARLLLAQFDAVVQHLAYNPSGHEEDLFKTSRELFSILPPEVPEIPTTVKFLHQFVEIQASRAPDNTALHFVERFDQDVPVGRRWTYKELDANGNRVAQMLLPHTKPGDIVAVYFDKCPEAYFSILGILKAGCAFVALDPAAPRSRNEFILQDSGASVLITSRDWKDSKDLTVAVLVLGVDEDALATLSPVPPILRRDLQPNDVCYCLYTSGTTGTPKGCEIAHDNAVQCMLAFQHIFKGHWQDDSKWLQFASLHFDVSVLEQYWSWSVGITLVVAPRDLILEDLAGTISRLEITHIDLTPSLARLLHPDDVPSLCKGVFITGGEALKQEILDVWGSKEVIYNFYGPTEATIGVTVFPRVPLSGRASNIGQQFVNVGSYVLKPGTEQPVLRGGVGELCVSGRLVGKGYLKREDLTSEKFPTLQHFQDRVYRTGDLVRVLHDGCFDFLGRADDQVKLRGQRLETGEINHCIRKGVEEVKDVATLVVHNDAQQKDLLVSFVVSDNGRKQAKLGRQLEIVESPEAAELCRRARDACRSKLPGYMVPTYVLEMPFIPLSANNKAEIKELRKFFGSLGQDKLMSLSSSTDTARGGLSTLGKRIAKVLVGMQGIDVSSVAPSSSIFELGIDSISVLRFSRALKKEGFAQASPSLILQNPLIGDLAATLEERKAVSNPDHVAAARQLVQACAHKHSSLVCRELGVVPEQIEYIAPCSPLQQGMISRSVNESTYFNTFQFNLSPNISTENLKKAMQKVLDELPILRTKFVGTTDGFVQVAVRGVPLPCSEIRLKPDTSIQDVIRKTRDVWITWNKECLSLPLEAILVDSGETHLLVLHIFHGLYDANSFRLILDRVAAEYLALIGKVSHSTDLNPAPAFPDALCYGPLQDFSSSKPFWIKHLDGVALLPTLSRSHSSSVATSQRRVTFTPLEMLRKSLGVTHQALVQAAWVSALANHLSVNPTIGIIVSGRNIELDGAERVVGPLFNTLPFHVQITSKEGLTWSSLVRQCHDFNATVLPFQHVPLRDIQKWCSGGQPLFDTLFSFQREEKALAEHDPLWTVVHSQPNADYPLALEATLGFDGSLHLLLVAQESTLNGPDWLAKMMNGLEQALVAMAQNPESPVSSKASMSADRLATSITTNGNPASITTNGHSHTNSVFAWGKEALVIRNEIAALADINSEAVDETAPLFGLGLDSIDIIKLSARLKKQGLGINTSELIKAQTIEVIVQHLQAHTPNETRDASREREISEVATASREYLCGELADGEIVLPTTPLQESMVAEMIESDFQLYFNHDILELAPSVDIVKLKEAWRAVVAGSPILRTRFLPIETAFLRYSYCQVVGQDPSVHMADVQLDSIDELAKVCDAATLRARKGAGRSDLLQLVFASVGNQRFLVLSIAHALYDGWSLNLVHRDVRAAYEGRYRAQSLESYIALVQDILFPEHGDASTFWSGFLRGVSPTIIQEKDVEERGIPVPDVPSTAVPEVPSTPVPAVPITPVPAVPSPSVPGIPEEGVPNVLSDLVSDDESGVPTPSSSELPVSIEEYSGQRHVVHRDDTASSIALPEITAFCKTHAITMQTLGQACWAALLASKTGCLDVTFGVVLSCRDREPLGELVFPTMNTVAVRSVLHGTISSWLRYMQDNMSSITSHQHFPLREAQKLAGCNGPLFSTLFIQQRGSSSPDKQRNEFLMQSIGGTAGVEYPVCVEMETAENVLVWRIACDGAYASQDETSWMLQDLDRVLGHVIRSPEAQVVSFSGQEVSVCGLNRVLLKTADATATEPSSGPAKHENEVWSPVEEMIREVLAEVSGVPATTIVKSNTIYHLGLDSISSIKAGSLLRKKGLAIGFRDMLKAGSITEMALLIRKTEQSPADSPRTDYSNGPADGFAVPTDVDLAAILRQVGFDEPKVEEILPASPMQVHMLSVWQNTKGQVFYPTFTYALSGQLDVGIISAAWQGLVAEISILRTVFVSTNSRSTPIHQVVLRATAPDHTSASSHDNTWDSRPTDDVSQPYNSLHAHRDGDRWILRVKIHHALYDAVSLPTIMERFAALCSSNCVQDSGGKRFNWRGFLDSILTDEEVAARKHFWTEYLSGIEPLALCFPQLEEQESNPRASLIKPAALQGISAITNLCKAKGISLQALFFAAYAHFLASAAVNNGKDKPDRVVFGIYLANRAETTERGAAFYPLLRLVPLRVVLRNDASLLEIAAEIQRDIHAISAPVNVEVGLWEIKDWTGVTVDSFVNFLGAPASAVGDDGESDVRLEVVPEQSADLGASSLRLSDGSEDCTAQEIAGNPVRDAFPVSVPSSYCIREMTADCS